MILYFEKEAAIRNRDWLRRLAKSPDPQLAALFRQMADDLDERLNPSKDKPQ